MLAVRGLLHAYRGRTDAGQADAARAVELAGKLGMPLLATMAAQAFGIAALSAGDARAAHKRLGPFADSALAAGLAEPALCRFLPDEVEALTRLGELGPAEALLGPFETRSVRLGRGWGIAAAGRCRGLLLAARGDLADGLAALEAGLEVHRRLAMPFEEARTLLATGEVHRRARHKRKAVVFLQAALVIFERLGAPRWQERTRDELARVGTYATPPGAGPVLTAAEQRVADLVAAGRTNAEVAAELFMGAADGGSAPVPGVPQAQRAVPHRTVPGAGIAHPAACFLRSPHSTLRVSRIRAGTVSPYRRQSAPIGPAACSSAD